MEPFKPYDFQFYHEVYARLGNSYRNYVSNIESYVEKFLDLKNDSYLNEYLGDQGLKYYTDWGDGIKYSPTYYNCDTGVKIPAN